MSQTHTLQCVISTIDHEEQVDHRITGKSKSKHTGKGKGFEDLSKLHTVSSSATNTLTAQVDEEIRRVYEIDNWSVMSQEWTNYLFTTDMTPNFTPFLGS